MINSSLPVILFRGLLLPSDVIGRLVMTYAIAVSQETTPHMEDKAVRKRERPCKGVEYTMRTIILGGSYRHIYGQKEVVLWLVQKKSLFLLDKQKEALSS